MDEKVIGLDECPKCHSTAVRPIQDLKRGGPRSYVQPMSCSSCLVTWLAIYRFVSIEPVDLVAKEVVNVPALAGMKSSV